MTSPGKKSDFTDSKRRITLDEYGIPDVAVANKILITLDDFGKSSEDLESHWEKWLHRNPFDAPVAEALVRLYKTRLEEAEQGKKKRPDEAQMRKMELVQGRAARYRMESLLRQDPPKPKSRIAYSTF